MRFLSRGPLYPRMPAGGKIRARSSFPRRIYAYSPRAESACPTRRTAVEYAGIAVISLVAGVAAPLLGIGGGLVAVPGLLLGIPSIGYATARACSTAMSVFNGWQSVWLYRKEKPWQLSTATSLAGGALAGGVARDLLIHVEGVVAFAQRLLAVTLFLTAARFAWDLRANVRPRT